MLIDVTEFDSFDDDLLSVSRRTCEAWGLDLDVAVAAEGFDGCRAAILPGDARIANEAMIDAARLDIANLLRLLQTVRAQRAEYVARNFAAYCALTGQVPDELLVKFRPDPARVWPPKG